MHNVHVVHVDNDYNPWGKPGAGAPLNNDNGDTIAKLPKVHVCTAKMSFKRNFIAKYFISIPKIVKVFLFLCFHYTQIRAKFEEKENVRCILQIILLKVNV